MLKLAPNSPSAPQTATAPVSADPPIGETHFRLLRLIEANPDLSQRDLARELGISLGKINYCLNALIEKGWVKVRNFRSSENKLSYAYLLTPNGIERKAAVTLQFLRRKMSEYENLKREIELLRAEVAAKSRGKSK